MGRFGQRFAFEKLDIVKAIRRDTFIGFSRRTRRRPIEIPSRNSATWSRRLP
jgi:hypothetical protein